MQIYKILSALLEYPEQELLDHLPEIRVEIGNSPDVDMAEKDALRKLLDHMANTPSTELQADYVKTFDLTPEHSLHLTHHLFGDDNDKNRGPALIDLGELYKDSGMKLTTNELPDYLPLILEFAALKDGNEAMEFLSDANKVLTTLTNNLVKANSPYAPLLSIVKSRSTPALLAA
ncbi:MAG: nitrate reductase molybdenum cofactor assembly chaperone [Sulfuricella sp.]|jgi:nitrate reductase delta subunit|nr:nitrate reductase molybdenum cofactor assembly chaperone [Sulfuricella sp.]